MMGIGSGVLLSAQGIVAGLFGIGIALGIALGMALERTDCVTF